MAPTTSTTDTGGPRSVISNDRVRKVVHKGLWTLASIAAHREGEVDTILRRAAPTGYGGELVVRRINGPVFIEPKFGYVISPHGRLIEDAMKPNFPHKSPWRIDIPSPGEFVKDRRHHPVQSFETVISLRHWWEWNYYHFYMDVLGKLPVLDAAGIPSDVPILIGRYYNQIPWVRDILSQGSLAKRQWIVHEEGLIEAQSVIYCRAQIPYGARAEYLATAMDVPKPTPGGDRRTFLGRRGPVFRQIVNLHDVLECLTSHGFEEADTLGISVREQMELFANTRHLVAVHGAGLVNIIYRQGSPMSVLELYGRGYNTWDYRTISHELGYAWQGLEGELIGPDPQLANLEIDVPALDSCLRQLN
jgi:hypothetical protein